MKKIIGLLLAMGTAVSATACSPGRPANNSRNLIAYFSRWGNADFVDG